ncbi:MAG: carboxymuconolactone decarboxylase family protein [Thermoleophilia bacterium]|jgi:AhpD family alkylhydroperoxidase|nr:carboxymuconolactone decarboxylase family protein [Thermoleophilia bacterium]
MTPLLPLVDRDQAPLAVRGLYPDDGDASNITKVMANAPDALAALAPFLGRVMGASTLDLATKEIVVLRVSALNRCAYCIPTHVRVARETGVPEAQVAVLATDAPPGEGFGAREALVVELCDRLVRDAASVDRALLDRLRVHLAEHEIMEVTLLAGAITLLNYVASAFDVPLDPVTIAALAAAPVPPPPA